MKLFPAIDIRNKKVVRLCQGDYDQMTVYAENPCDIARDFNSVGAKNLHVVDLDGALDGKLVNFASIESIVRATDMFVEVGGGIRDEDRIKQYLDAGVGRVILGTVAIENINFVEKMVNKYGSSIAVGVDAKDGFVAIHGWKTVTDIRSFDFCKQLNSFGVQTIIYTDIAKDGLLAGTNLDAYKTLSDIDGLDIVASGGITFLPELVSLKKMNIYGAILGKALYAGRLSLKDALEIVEED